MNNKNSLINKQLEEHVSIIIDTLLSTISGVHTIILYGSYGRSEGAWIKASETYNPYNDYDLLIVLEDEAKHPKDLPSIKEKLLNQINIKWVDLSFVSLTKFIGNRNKSIFQYDLIYGSKVIFGNFKILESIQKFDSSEINLNEGKLLFFTRLWAFMGGVVTVKDLNSSEAIFFRYQMSKVVLAVVDMILLINGRYVSSYVERCNLAIKICKREDILKKELINWAINEKLNPSTKVMTKKEVICLQENVANIFSIYALRLLSIIHKKNFSNLVDFKNLYATSLFERLKIFAGLILRKNTNYRKVYILNIIQILIVSNILGQVSLKWTLNECNKLLQKIGFESTKNLDQLRQLVANERFN